MSNIVVSGSEHKYFRMDIESEKSVTLLSSEEAFKKAAKQYLMISTIDWDWREVTGDISGSLALAGVSESFILEIWTDLKKEIEEKLDIQKNDTIFLAYDFLAHTEITKDEEGKTMQNIVEYVTPKYIINPKTNKAIKLENGMEEF